MVRVQGFRVQHSGSLKAVTAYEFARIAEQWAGLYSNS